MYIIDTGKYKEYERFTHSVFNWLNGKVNKINIASCLQITTNGIGGFGKRLGGKILVDLYSIVSHYSEYDNLIKGFIVDVVCHELFHMDQDINNLKYSQDLEYRQDIENQVRYLTAQYILENYDILRDVFKSDFSTTPMEYTLQNLKDVHIPQYRFTSLKQVYEYHLKILSLGKDIDIDEYDSIYFNYKYSNGGITDFVIKANNGLSKYTYKFNKLMEDVYTSQGTCTIEECETSTFGKTLIITVEQSMFKNMITKITNIAV